MEEIKKAPARGGRKSTTWSKGRDPRFNKPKGSKHAITKLKEQLGQNWENLAQYLVQEGAEKAFKELKKLDKTSFLKYYLQLVEFIKPKLTRTTIEAGNKAKLKIIIKKTETNYFVDGRDFVESDSLTDARLIDAQRVEPNK